MTWIPFLLLPVSLLTPHPKISEIRTDSAAPVLDVEYIELTGVAGTSLDGLSVVVIGDSDTETGPNLGDSGFIEAVIPLDGHTIPKDRSLLIHASGLLLAIPDIVAECGLEDGDNLTVLIVRDCMAYPGEDVDADDNGVMDYAPWAEIIDSVSIVMGEPGKVSEWVYSDSHAGPDGGAFVFHARHCLDTGEWMLGSSTYTIDSLRETAGSLNPPCDGSLCSGDVTDDGMRDSADLAVILSHWGELGTIADLDGDGLVSSGDIAALLSVWGACEL